MDIPHHYHYDLFRSAGIRFLKKASSHNNIKDCICSIYLYLGGGLYIICALLNIWVLKYLDYSKMLPLTSITYIWTLILAFLIFKEK